MGFRVSPNTVQLGASAAPTTGAIDIIAKYQVIVRPAFASACEIAASAAAKTPKYGNHCHEKFGCGKSAAQLRGSTAYPA